MDGKTTALCGVAAAVTCNSKWLLGTLQAFPTGREGSLTEVVIGQPQPIIALYRQWSLVCSGCNDLQFVLGQAELLST